MILNNEDNFQFFWTCDLWHKCPRTPKNAIKRLTEVSLDALHQVTTSGWVHDLLHGWEKTHGIFYPWYPIDQLNVIWTLSQQ